MSRDDDSTGFAVKVFAVGVGCVGVTTGALFVLGLGCWMAWVPFARFGVSQDLDDYKTWVAASNLEAAQRSKTLARISDIRKGVKKGYIKVPFLDWTQIDGEIDDLIDDQHFGPGEHKALLRQLGRIERYRTSK